MLTRDTTVDHLKAYQLTLHALFLLLFQCSTVDEVLTIHKLGNPAQPCLQRRGGITEVVSIQAESHLQAQGITRTKSDRTDTKLLPSLEDSLPNLVGIFRIEIEFKTSSTRIAGIGDNYIFTTSKRAMGEMVVRHSRKIDICQFLQGSQSLRALYGQLSRIITGILQLCPSLIVAYAPVPVLLYIGGIDHQ